MRDSNSRDVPLGIALALAFLAVLMLAFLMPDAAFAQAGDIDAGLRRGYTMWITVIRTVGVFMFSIGAVMFAGGRLQWAGGLLMVAAIIGAVKAESIANYILA